MRFYLDATGSDESGVAKLTMGAHPGGDLVATVPFKTPLDKKRARMLQHVPMLFEEFEGMRGLWFYTGNGQCPHCNGVVPGASPVQIERIEALRDAMMPPEDEALGAPDPGAIKL